MSGGGRTVDSSAGGMAVACGSPDSSGGGMAVGSGSPDSFGDGVGVGSGVVAGDADTEGSAACSVPLEPA